MDFPDLSLLFRPTSIAIVGASDRPSSLGRRVVENLLEHSDFDGDVFLVNPRQDRIAGHRCYPTVTSIGRAVDVALIVVPAQSVLDALQQCAAQGMRFAIVMTSGFGETGGGGQAAQDAIAALARSTGMRIIGPNCPGLTNVVDNIGMTFSPGFRTDHYPGPIGLATQGGGLGRNALQSGTRGGGAALWASLGNAADLDVPEVIQYFTEDPRITVIVILLEGINDGPALVASLLAAARAGKPVVALKVGRSEYGARAIQSHTAALAGSAVVNSAVLKQFGAVEVRDTDELMDVGWLLSRAVPPPRTRVAIWGLSGGALTLAADLVGQAGLELATLSEPTERALREVLPEYAAINNPVDVTATGITDLQLSRDSLRILAADPAVDIVLIPDPLDYGELSADIGRAIVETQEASDTALLPVWMSDGRGPGFTALADAGFCSPRSLTKAVDAIRRWADHGKWRADYAEQVISAPLALQSPDNSVLPDVGSEPLAKSWLAEHGIPVPQGTVVTVDAEVEEAVSRLTGPLVAKVVSRDLAHKSDAGGVVVGIDGPEAALSARNRILDTVGLKAPEATIEGVLFEELVDGDVIELIVGVHRDPTFGPVITLGAGGVLVELFNDSQHRLIPIDHRGALDMINGLHLRPLLDGLRGAPPRDVDALAELLVKVSDLVMSYAEIEEMDLNPIVLRPASSAGDACVAVDAHVVTSTSGSGS